MLKSRLSDLYLLTVYTEACATKVARNRQQKKDAEVLEHHSVYTRKMKEFSSLQCLGYPHGYLSTLKARQFLRTQEFRH